MIRKLAPHRRAAAAVGSACLALLALPLLLANRMRRRRATPARILVIEPWGIGDLVLATGALRALRRAYPDAHIAVLAKSYAPAVVVDVDMADEVIAYDFPWTAFRGKYRLGRYRFGELWRLVLTLRRARYELVLNARADVRNNVLGALAGGRRFVSLSCGPGDFLATDVVHSSEESHRSDDWRLVVERVCGPAPAAATPRLTVPAALRDDVAAALGLRASPGQLVIGVHPGARIAVRRWPLERFAAVADELAARLGARLVVFAEPDGYGADLPVRSHFVVVQRSLREMMAAFTACDVLVCNDSGPMHVANALGVPVVALFGPTKLEWFGPRGGESRIVRIDEVECRPCFDVCRFAEPHCMTRLEEHMVIDGVVSVLAARGRPGGATRAGATWPPAARVSAG